MKPGRIAEAMDVAAWLQAGEGRVRGFVSAPLPPFGRRHVPRRQSALILRHCLGIRLPTLALAYSQVLSTTRHATRDSDSASRVRCWRIGGSTSATHLHARAASTSTSTSRSTPRERVPRTQPLRVVWIPDSGCAAVFVRPRARALNASARRRRRRHRRGVSCSPPSLLRVAGGQEQSLYRAQGLSGARMAGGVLCATARRWRIED
ncbi:hypothetical protein B0H11DRAFT_79237 [Mycena galericulata]|nr:hypothetical protein B0H11DRAFT_79237 [Mycena galericulata]